MLIELLRTGAREFGEQPAVLAPGRAISYAQLLQRSESFATGLASRGIGRFGCAVDDLGELIALLCGASASGSEACVYPDSLGQAELHEQARAFGHELLVSDRDMRSSELEVLSPEDVAAPPLAPAELQLPPQMPVLIMTTGTTGRPRGARHDWRRLVDGTRRANEPAGTRWLLAYNMHQFAAIQVLLHVLANRATLVEAASRRPPDALRALREFKVTHVSATPTFWRLLLSVVGPPEASELALEQITISGEAAPEFLLRRLRELFPSARISQIFATTEIGSAVSVRDERAGLPLSLLDRDEQADVQFRISDGELQVRSRIGMEGYWGEQPLAEGWRGTGDLVQVQGDRLHFVGRVGDTINVGGVKVHPLPVEERVSSVHGVELARAYGRPNPVTGQIVALEVVVSAGANLEQVEDQIRQACEDLPAAARPRRISFVEALEVRGSKIARRGGELTQK